ncbi:MAG: SDR family oxidoreductase [Myxococcales bacterium]|nr:SDR family oxidoreductase [Myxococcales bacterium]MCB9706360.1 SDR family oxidoreductase [Myxococcales bacterium]
MAGRFEGKGVVVSGASSGIGRATALAAAREGADLVLIGRKQAALDEVAAEIRALGRRATAVVADLMDADARRRAIDGATAALEGIDLLVNAAGVIASGTIETTALADFEAMFALNTTAPFHLIQLALPALKARRGAVVNVSSVTGIRSFPGVLAYCSSKAALDQLTRCVALELAADGVRVNAVCPGVVVSQLHRRGGMDEARYAAFLEHSKTTHPLGRVGEPDEIAALILFLGGGESGWITGVTMPIDGGRHLTCAR